MNENVHEIECIAEIDDSKVYKVDHKIPKTDELDEYLYHGADGEDYGIFKLSPRECCRLMNFKDSDIDKMMEVNSRTQIYKQAGNSIVVSVLVALFSQLHIQGIKSWNEMTDEERYEIIRPGE